MASKKKIFDSVQMVREIRDAYYRIKSDPNYDRREFEKIKKKWAHLLEQQEKIKAKKTIPTKRTESK
ncbi:MAG: hypothetical protein HYS25_11965 [Ignavibacteriales bacterium]|nr:hypothetical protein [Ignavibacteriales bacterium]